MPARPSHRDSTKLLHKLQPQKYLNMFSIFFIYSFLYSRFYFFKDLRLTLNLQICKL